MNCREAGALLTAHRHSELGDAETQNLETHLAQCPSCTSDMRAIASAVNLLESLPSASAPPQIWSGLEAEFRSAPKSRFFLGRLTPAAVFLCLLAGIGLWVQIRSPTIKLVEHTEPLPHEAMARALHQKRLFGELRDYVHTNEATELRAYALEETGMEVELADTQPEETANRIKLVGGWRIPTQAAVLIGMEVDRQPVSLLVLKRDPASVERGLFSKQVFYRKDPATGLKSLSWTNPEKSYVLTSTLDGVGETACFSCHVDNERRRLIRSLRPGS